MSADTSSQKPKSRIAFATIRMPDGKEHEVPLAPKTFVVRFYFMSIRRIVTSSVQHTATFPNWLSCNFVFAFK